MLTLRDYFKKAAKQSFAIGAFNAANLETVKAIIAAAKNLKSPVIIESSPGETAYIEPENLHALVENAKKETGLPIFVNLDHGNSLDSVSRAISAGYEMVHFDGSNLDFETNKKLTKQVVEIAKAKDVVVEGELGFIPGKSGLYTNQSILAIQEKGILTNPLQAKEFLEFTGIDVLAVFIGNVHGVYNGPKKLNLQRLADIRQTTQCWLSLHGGSSIPKQDIKTAIKYGIVKINVNSELRIAYKKISKKMLDKSLEMAVYKLMPPVIAAMQKIVEEKIKIFGSEGKIYE